ncbi:hypothetical protein HFP89_08150 [Wenzhouxiangella sp. XN79A]|uniref:hypothetical protein n=1 Tax=Wenzhouxiangella sp. XN79A TaxID=2724193 RepID=UPI00144A4DAD|nr:hypothetical protein [Wenzhouxiangella sp. XN79A]NKI35136.1 hypothetical protein [Wenzhouxiangella sp. XN79A]
MSEPGITQRVVEPRTNAAVASDRPQAGAEGRQFLTGLRGHVRAGDASIRALALAECPGLESLDLSDCSPGLYLQIELPAGLRQLRLPQDAPGAIIQIQLPAAFRPVQPIVIEGALADVGLEAPWMVHPFHLDAAKDRSPFQGLLLGPALHGPVDAAISTQLVLGRARAAETLDLDACGLERLVLLGSMARRIRLSNARLHSLQAIECPRLERVEGEFASDHAAFDVCRRLDTVEGRGERLAISCSGRRQLRIHGRWDRIELSYSDVQRVELSSGTRLELISLPAVREVQCPEPFELGIDGSMRASDHLAVLLDEPPGRLGDLVERECDRFRHGHSLPGHWLRLMSGGIRVGDELPRAMGLLKELARRKSDREAAWRVRCHLNALHRDPDIDTDDSTVAFRSGSAAWCWFDGAPEHHGLWLDDLALYFRCREERVTARFTRTLARLDRLIHAEVLALALTGQRKAGFDRAACLNWLAQCLQRIDGARELRHMNRLAAIHRHWRPVRHDHDRRLTERLRRLIHALGELEAPGLLAAMVEPILSTGSAAIALRAGIDLLRVERETGLRVISRGLSLDGEVPAGLRAAALRELLTIEERNERTGDPTQ